MADPLEARDDGAGWRALRAEEDLPAFMDAAVALHRGLLDRLPAAHRPHFHDHWLRRFNDARAWLLGGAGGPDALVTVPRLEGLHSYRWQTRTLACRDDAHGRLVLPPEVDLSRSFAMPRPEGAPAIRPALAGTDHEPVQLAYVRRLDGGPGGGPGDEEAADGPWTFRAATRADLAGILALLERSYADLDDVDDGLGRQREELRQIVDHDGGWCFVAVADGATAPVAMASYIAMELPLAGAPAALVADLAVDPPARGRGLARTLQGHAYRRLRDAGLSWVYGNIGPENDASRRQAEATGREIWVEVVRFRPRSGRARGADGVTARP
ncbi:MAG: GNAT family N-acetyltransferase [Planctomycetota bacterium]